MIDGLWGTHAKKIQFCALTESDILHQCTGNENVLVYQFRLTKCMKTLTDDNVLFYHLMSNDMECNCKTEIMDTIIRLVMKNSSFLVLEVVPSQHCSLVLIHCENHKKNPNGSNFVQEILLEIE